MTPVETKEFLRRVASIERSLGSIAKSLEHMDKSLNRHIPKGTKDTMPELFGEPRVINEWDEEEDDE